MASPPSTFYQLQALLGSHDVGLFANRNTRLLPQYGARQPGRGALSTDVMYFWEILLAPLDTSSRESACPSKVVSGGYPVDDNCPVLTVSSVVSSFPSPGLRPAYLSAIPTPQFDTAFRDISSDYGLTARILIATKYNMILFDL